MRLVLVDNDADALDLVVLDLRLEGHDVVATATNGDDAVAACERVRPDVLVVDYRMAPGIDGVEVARRVLNAGTARRVLLYSNYSHPATVEAARVAGAHWLRKGDVRSLRAAVAEPLSPIDRP